MDLKLWDELAPLFEQALEMDTATRCTFLDALKAQNTTLWRELSSLLENLDEATPYLADIQGVVRHTLKAGCRHKDIKKPKPIWKYHRVHAVV